MFAFSLLLLFLARLRLHVVNALPANAYSTRQLSENVPVLSLTNETVYVNGSAREYVNSLLSIPQI